MHRGMILAVLLLVYAYVSCSSPCSPRSFPSIGENYIVCVCNATFCDEYEDLRPTGQAAAVYTSSQAGLRMHAIHVPISRIVRRRNESLKWKKKSATTAFRIKVDVRSAMQEMIGFGGAFTDSAGLNIMALSEATRKRLMHCIYGDKGGRYSTGRVPIASTDFSASRYSYDDVINDVSLTHFALSSVDERLKIPLIKEAMRLSGGRLRLFASPWSAPAWMKETGKMEGPGKLRKGLERTWAAYFVKFFDAYASHGVSFWATTVQNEPTSGALPYYTWQTMYWNATGERSFASAYLGPALRASKSAKNVHIIALDDNRLWLPEWANTVFSDASAASFIAGIGVHWYLDRLTSSSRLAETHKAHPNKFILATEACSGNLLFERGPILGDWQRAEAYASSIIDDCRNYVAGWTDWNLALDLKGGPTWANNFVDATLLVNATADEFLKQPTHYALVHFSRFVRPGSRRVKSTSTGSASLMHVTFVDQGQRILVLLNKKAVEIDVTIEDAAGATIALKVAPKSISTVLWNKSI